MRSENTVMSAFALHPVRLGSIEAYAAELSRQLAKIGWNSVLVFVGPPSKEAMDLFSLPNTRIEVVENCGKLGWRPFRDMMRLISSVRPQILHLHFMDAWNFYPWLAKLYSVDKVFMTDHNSRPAEYCPTQPALWKRPLIKIGYYPIRKIFCVSSFVRQCVCEELMLSEYCAKLIYNGVDINRAEVMEERQNSFRLRYSIPDDRIIVLQVSWLIPEKGIEDLLRAARIVLEKNEQVHFLLAGDGPYYQTYQKMVENFGITGNVSFLGVVKDPSGEGLFAASDIVCQVSRWEEAFGLTITEAMASKKPVIASRVGGIPELVVDGQSGYLVKAKDSEAIAKAILILVEDSKLRESMGQIGYDLCRSKFNLALNVASLIDHYMG